MNKLTIDNLELAGKRVLVRADYNVPLDENLNITDDKRIMDSLPTLWRVIVEGGKLILISHLGRPKGKVDKKLSLKPVAEKLSIFLNREVKLAPDCIGPEVEKMVNNMKEGDVLLLENTRFHKEETDGDEEFAQKMANLGDVFINNAFGIAHRAHASVSVIARHFKKSAAGYLIIKEMKYIGETMRKPKRPFAAILAGVKIDGKIDVINRLLDLADKIFLGGGIANTVLLAQGYEVGDSVVERDKVDVAKAILEKAAKNNAKIFLPIDMLCGREFKNDTERKYFDADKQEKGWIAMGIGPKTVELFKKELEGCKTVLWNGPLGVFEFDNFSKETFEIAKFIAEKTEKDELKSIIGGGDTAAAVKKAGIETRFSHVSTGGGASLQYIEGKKLPGIATITDVGMPTSRRFLIAGNWKMNKTVQESMDFANKLIGSVKNDGRVDAVICPPFTDLYPVNDIIKNTHIELGAQNLFWEETGAFTGEISPAMLRSTGVRYVIIGHSERRQLFGETDTVINRKVLKALEYDFKPIICVGETLQEREFGREKEVVEHQLRSALKSVEYTDTLYLIIAYEPVWAIGTGKTATPAQAEEMHRFIREILKDIYGSKFSKAVRILYGGSVKPSNAKDLFQKPNIDGGLIGGAALKLKDFCEIITTATKIFK